MKVTCQGLHKILGSSNYRSHSAPHDNVGFRNPFPDAQGGGKQVAITRLTLTPWRKIVVVVEEEDERLELRRAEKNAQGPKGGGALHFWLVSGLACRYLCLV